MKKKTKSKRKLCWLLICCSFVCAVKKRLIFLLFIFWLFFLCLFFGCVLFLEARRGPKHFVYKNALLRKNKHMPHSQNKRTASEEWGVELLHFDSNNKQLLQFHLTWFLGKNFSPHTAGLKILAVENHKSHKIY